MTPLVGEPKDKSVPSIVMLIGEKEFLKGLKEDKMPCFFVVVKPKDDTPRKEKQTQETLRKVGPKEVVDLLDQYKGIITYETTDTLPPKREINHCID